MQVEEKNNNETKDDNNDGQDNNTIQITKFPKINIPGPHKFFLSFGTTDTHDKPLQKLAADALSSNVFDAIVALSETDLPQFCPYFWKSYGDYLRANPRGFGYWLWKPYLVWHTLQMMEYDDILIYADAGCTLNLHGIPRLLAYIRRVQTSELGILTFQTLHKEKTFCKHDLLQFLEMDTPEVHDSGNIIASTFVIRKCSHTIQIVTEWLNLATSNDFHFIDDSISTECTEYPEFQDHRHDQSIFSLLCKKYGTEYLNDETFHDFSKPEEWLNFPLLVTRLKNNPSS